MDWDWYDSVWVNQVLVNYSYDVQDKLIEAIYKSRDGVNWINANLINYEYDVNNYLVLEVVKARQYYYIFHLNVLYLSFIFIPTIIHITALFA